MSQQTNAERNDTRSCAYCKTEFIQNRFWQRFCSKECRLSFTEAINKMGECPHCGGELLHKKSEVDDYNG